MIRRPLAELVRQKFNYSRIRLFWLKSVVFLDDNNELASSSAGAFRSLGDEVKCFGWFVIFEDIEETSQYPLGCCGVDADPVRCGASGDLIVNVTKR